MSLSVGQFSYASVDVFNPVQLFWGYKVARDLWEPDALLTRVIVD